MPPPCRACVEISLSRHDPKHSAKRGAQAPPAGGSGKGRPRLPPARRKLHTSPMISIRPLLARAAASGLALAGAVLLAAVHPARAAAGEFKARPDAVRAHVKFLADDRLQGREAGSPGYDIAAAYVAAQFEALGLKPAGGAGGYLQPTPLSADRVANEGRITLRPNAGGRVPLVFGVDYFPYANPSRARLRLDAPLAFAGFGIVAADRGRDDYEGLDVRGKIVVALRGAPKGWQSEERAYYASARLKRAEAAKRGAVGFLTVYTPTTDRIYGFQRAKLGWNALSMTWVGPDGAPFEVGPSAPAAATISLEGAKKLFAGAPTPLDAILRAAEAENGAPPRFDLPMRARIEVDTIHARVNSANVAGLIEGADPRLKNEVVVLSAHLDHIGVLKGVRGDAINNGAMDNAAGVATLLEAARGFAESAIPPKRSILFLALTAEEKGLVGAEYFARNPTVPRESIIANVNLDMPILTYEFTDVVAFGAERSDLGAIVKGAAARLGVALSPDPTPDEGTFTRSDHFRFVEQGVPSIMLVTGDANGGADAKRLFRAERYHRPGDDLSQPIRYDVAAKFARLNYEIARDIADAPRRPAWRAGDFFATLFSARAAPGAAP